MIQERTMKNCFHTYFENQRLYFYIYLYILPNETGLLMLLIRNIKKNLISKIADFNTVIITDFII